MSEAQANSEPRLYPGRGYVWLAVALALLAPVLYVVQVAVQHTLVTPWYAPLLNTAAVLLTALALVRARSFWRILNLLWIGLLAGVSWFFMLSMSRLPPYAGPVAVGQSFPSFTTELADGTSFNQDDLKGDRDTVMIFFRGRW
jgi:hypothetical protein